MIPRSGSIDLTTPPDRAEAGLADGRPSVTYQRDDHQPFPVEVRLPGGTVLAVDARLVTFDALSQADPVTAAPTTMDIHHYAATLADGRDHLLAAAELLGLDSTPILEWYGAVSQPEPADVLTTVRTRWLESTVDFLRVEVQGSYKGPVDTPESDQTIVHYVLTW